MTILSAFPLVINNVLVYDLKMRPTYRHKKNLRKVFTFYSTLTVIIGLLLYFFVFSSDPPAEKVEPTILPPQQELTVSPPLPRDLIRIEQTVKRGDTIINALKRQGLDYQSAHDFFTDVKPVYDLKRIAAGKQYTLYVSGAGRELLKFKYQIDINQYLEAVKDEHKDRFNAKVVTIPYQTEVEIIEGSIDFSLFQSILDSGEKPELADILASMYEYDVDFNRDIRKGDSFAVIVEKKYLKGEFMAYGAVIACEFVNRGNAIRLVRFTDPDGDTAYYHPDGRSARKMFLRCALPFMRVTSGYGNRRHPVLGFSARHNGIDLAAPTGTKIRATATGVIKRKGYHSGRGKYITIRHPNHYVTNYYHLSRFAKGIRPGVKVQQAQLIGYVGATGLATGPHLHYGVYKNGRFVNPLRMKSPTKKPVKQKFLAQFKQHARNHFLLMAGNRIVKIPKPVRRALLKTTPDTSSRTQ